MCERWRVGAGSHHGPIGGLSVVVVVEICVVGGWMRGTSMDVDVVLIVIMVPLQLRIQGQ